MWAPDGLATLQPKDRLDLPPRVQCNPPSNGAYSMRGKRRPCSPLGRLGLGLWVKRLDLAQGL